MDIIEEHESGAISIGSIEIPPPPKSVAFDASTPRLIISHIESENFKSYPGQQSIGLFDKSFTAIVGPNGCGKSNIIDSILFAFGSKSQKIRSKNAESLIHKSSVHGEKQSCTVTINFKRIIDLPDDKMEEVPGSCFSISRTVDRNNKNSHYCINNRRCQFKEVYSFLSENGVDLDHNRFLISQGEVEQITRMKPISQHGHDIGMLEYLEDIFGTNRLKGPINIFVSRIDELVKQEAEKLNQVKTAEREKAALEKPKNDALAYLKNKNRLIRLKNKEYQIYLLRDTKKRNAHEREKQAEQDCLKATLNQIALINDKLKKSKNDNLAREAQKQETKKNLENIRNNYKKIKSKRDRSELEEKELEKRALQLTQTLEIENENLGKLVEELSTKQGAQQKEKENVERELTKLNQEEIILKNRVSERAAALGALKADVAKRKLNLTAANTLYLSCRDLISNARSYLTQMKSDFDKMSSDLKTKITSAKQLNEKLENLKILVEDNEREMSDVSNEEERFNELLLTNRKKLVEMKKLVKKTRSNVLKELITEKKKGTIPGFIGRLGDLGTIDKKYDVAISTACPALDHILTDTIDTARLCVEHLKKNNIGQATFIGLDKMDQWIESSKKEFQTSQDFPRLFDRIQVDDERFRPAFYYALRDTLVADDISAARTIAFVSPRKRVVTLQGQLIEKSGVMSGGGRIISGRMGSNTELSTADIDQLSITIDNLFSRINHLERRKDYLTNIIQKQNNDGKAIEQELHSLNGDIEILSQTLNTMDIEDEELRVENLKLDETQLANYRRAVMSATEEFDHSRNKADKVEGEIKNLEARELSIAAAKKKLATTSKQIQKSEKHISSTEKKVVRINNKIEMATTELQKMEYKIKQLQEESVKLDGDLTSFKKQVKTLEGVLKEDKKNEHQAFEEQTKQLADLKTVEDKMLTQENKMQLCDEKISKLDEEISHWKNELKELKLNEVEGEENLPLQTYSSRQLKKTDLATMKSRISSLEKKLKKKRIDVAVIEKFKKKEQLHKDKLVELNTLTCRLSNQREIHRSLCHRRRNEFMTGFDVISYKLTEVYNIITSEGEANLESVDPLDPFSKGITISVRPPNEKTWQNMSTLSGGEKAILSIALISALNSYVQSPFYLMDEIDAALSVQNIQAIGHYIKERSKYSQFVVVSHRDIMYDLARTLIGVTKRQDDCSLTFTASSHFFTRH